MPPTHATDNAPVEPPAARSAFLSPVVWMLALIVGHGRLRAVHRDLLRAERGEARCTASTPAAAGVIISTGYLTAIVVNLIVGLLADRFNKLVVLGGVFVLLAVASASMTVEASDDLPRGDGAR